MENEKQSIQYPVNLTADYPEKSSRWLALATLLGMIPKMIILIPHVIALYVIQIISFFAWVIGQFAVLFTGRYPKSLYDFLLGALRWQTRASAYIFGLTDKYPPFTLQ
jgi:hypothetical protein